MVEMAERCGAESVELLCFLNDIVTDGKMECIGDGMMVKEERGKGRRCSLRAGSSDPPR